ncbi:hypothetical protein AAVH_41161 [Aphelenchoides avenae]|nr:hypothetical protein AAVH_41161 [Aphelenchus avenae]
MADAIRKAASAGKSILFVVDAPQSDMLQDELLWELSEAFPSRSKLSSPRFDKSLYVVFLQPQRLADCWPDVCNGRLSHCNECSEMQVDDAPGMDGPVLVDVYHLPLADQVLMTVELFFAREHYADRVTAIRVTCGGCESLADNADASAALTVVNGRRRRRSRLGGDQRATDVYSEAFKFLHRSELDACELVGRQWLKHIRSVAAVLPLHHIPSAVVSATKNNLASTQHCEKRPRIAMIMQLLDF